MYSWLSFMKMFILLLKQQTAPFLLKPPEFVCGFFHCMLKIKTFSDGDVIHLLTLLLPQMFKVPRQVCVFIKLTFGHHLGNVVSVKLLLRCDCDMKFFFYLCIFFIATKAFKASKRSCPFGLWLETSKHPKEFSIHWGCSLGGHRDGDCYIPTWFSRTLMVAPSLHCQRHHKKHPANHTWDCEKVHERQRCTKPFWGVSCPLFFLILSKYRHLLVDFKTTGKR